MIDKCLNVDLIHIYQHFSRFIVILECNIRSSMLLKCLHLSPGNK